MTPLVRDPGMLARMRPSPVSAIDGIGVAREGRAGVGEFYLTILPDPQACGAKEEAASVYGQLAAFLRQRGAMVAQERVYGRCEASGTIMGVRRDLLGDDLPATFIEGRPCNAGMFAGVHVVAVVPSPEIKVETITWKGVRCGRRVEIGGTTYIYLSGINGLGAGGAPAQAREMFLMAQRILEAQGGHLRSVLRTWIYIPNILDWYPEFNRARNEVFRVAGLLADGAAVWLPASTGIQARNPLGAECLMDVLAVLPGTARDTNIEMVISPLQNEPLAYGAAFSRGVRINDGDVSRVYVSGTASIDRDGVTSHSNDAASQIRTTIEIIGRLLDGQGMSFVDLCQATVFFKSLRDVAKFRDLWATIDAPPIPLVCTRGNICRKDLLFEMDAQAMGPREAASRADD